jgi:hypothetical protein
MMSRSAGVAHVSAYEARPDGEVPPARGTPHATACPGLRPGVRTGAPIAGQSSLPRRASLLVIPVFIAPIALLVGLAGRVRSRQRYENHCVITRFSETLTDAVIAT